jgi:cell division protease FtsH
MAKDPTSNKRSRRASDDADGNLPNPRQGSPKPDGAKRPRLPLWALYVAIMAGLLLVQFYVWDGQRGQDLDYSAFLSAVQNGYVEEVNVINNTAIEGLYTQEAIDEGLVERPEPAASPLGSGEDAAEAARSFRTTKPADHDLTDYVNTYNEGAADEGKAPVAYDARIETSWLAEAMTWIFPIFLLVILWLFLMRRMGGPGQQVLNIGKSKASLFDNQDEQKVTFKDVAGLDEAKEEVEEVVDFLKNPKRFTKLGGKLPKGVLLVGPPGTGKTLLGKAVAGEAGVPFFSLSGSDFVEMFVGVGAARVRDLFKQAKEKAPCIIFIDEIDAIGRSRGKGMMVGGNDERENTLNQLLVEMDGFNTDKGVIIMAATNRPDVLDQALLRPGRFDRQILVDRPDRIQRAAIFRVHTRPLKLAESVDMEMLANMTPGFAGAEIANVCNEAALLAARDDKDAIETVDFERAIDRVIGGLEKKNKLISPEERKIVAYHEAGHAIAGWFQQHTDPVIKVSIVPRGLAALGFAQSLPDERYINTKEAFYDQMVMMIAGRVAEEITFGHLSTGAQNDLERITRLAYAMVTFYGMSDKVGHLSFNPEQSGKQQATFYRPYSDQTAELIDAEVKEVIDEAHRRAHVLLREKGDLMEALAQALLSREVLNENDLEALLGKRPYERRSPRRPVNAEGEPVGGPAEPSIHDVAEHDARPEPPSVGGDGATDQPEPQRPGTDV